MSKLRWEYTKDELETALAVICTFQTDHFIEEMLKDNHKSKYYKQGNKYLEHLKVMINEQIEKVRGESNEL